MTNFNVNFRTSEYCLSSTFILAHPTFGYLLLCKHCSQEMPQQIEDISKGVIKLEKSISWIKHVHISKRNPIPLRFRTCSPYQFGFHTSVVYCIPYVLSSHYNYSVFPTENGMGPLTNLKFDQPSSTIFNQVNFIDPSIRKNIWINYGSTIDQYDLVLYVGRGDFNFLKLFLPMGIWLWVGLVVSFGILGLLLGAYYSDGFEPAKIANSVVIIFSILMEQSVPMDERKTSQHPMRRNAFLLLPWIWACFILCNCYKGDLFSYLTKDTPPPTPDSFEAIANSDIMIATSTKHYFNGTAYSTLKDYVLADLSYGEDGYSEFFMRFRHFSKFFRGEMYSVVRNISEGKAVDTDRGMTFMPDIFATVSARRDSDIMKVLVSRFCVDYFIDEKKMGPNPYVSRTPWFGDRNIYSEMLIKGLAHLVESGIYEKWHRNFELFKIIWELRRGDKAINVSSLNYFGLLVMQGESVIEMNEGEGKFVPVVVNNITICLALFAGGLAISFVSMGLELLVRNLKRDKKWG